MCAVCVAARARATESRAMTDNRAFIHAALDKLSKRRMNKHTFRMVFSDQLLEGLESKGYIVVHPDDRVELTVPGVKHLIELEGLNVDVR